MALKVTFPKNHDRARLAVFEWDDGLVATTPVWGRAERLPHDLSHYAIEAQFLPPYGFWSMAERQAPFESLTLVRGRWPRGRREWLDRVRRKHGGEMLKAEAVELGPLADPAVELDAVWSAMARSFKRAYDFGPANPFSHVTKSDLAVARQRYFELTDAWQRVPWGGALVVAWPPGTASVIPRYDAEMDLRPRQARK